MRASPSTLVAAAAIAAVAAAPSCERYEPPPQPRIVGLAGSVLSDPRAPLVVDFGTTVAPDTVRAKVVVLDTNVEGDLADEDEDPDTELRVLLQRDPSEDDRGGRTELVAGGRMLRFVADAALPVGPKLALLVEPGLSTTSGRRLERRIRIPFSFTVLCGAGATAAGFRSGTYFALLDVEQPLGSQIQLYGSVDVDPATGAFRGRFTNADRDAQQVCPTPCGSADVCRLLPRPECVAPSTRAGVVDEQPDFVPNAAPPTGYSFAVHGCATDDGAAVGVVTAPANLVVESPPVTVEGLVMTAQFAAAADGSFRATGSLGADAVLLGGNRVGAGKGTMTAIYVEPGRAPVGIPAPPAREVLDGGP